MTTAETPATGRALATIETIASLRDIPDADAIVCARIRGWDVVVKRGEFEVGDRCVYFEVDSLLDVTDERFAFLAPRGVRTDTEGRSGHVLKTARLRGQYSQGLALPVAVFPEVEDLPVGSDVTAALNVVKWDPPIPASIAGQVRGMLPSWIPVTDEERIQNLTDILDATGVERWTATEKIDGTSTSVYVDPVSDLVGVCSRNLDLLPNDANTLWRMAAKHDLHARLAEAFPDSRVVVQGETYGEGIQGNPLKVRGQHFAAFTLRVDGAEVPRSQWPAWLLALSVPERPEFTFPVTLEEALAQVETLKSAIAPERAAEGLVWRGADHAMVTLPNGRIERASFKVISRRYLLKFDR